MEYKTWQICVVRSQKSVPLVGAMRGMARKVHKRSFWSSGDVLFLNLGPGDERGGFVYE